MSTPDRFDRVLSVALTVAAVVMATVVAVRELRPSQGSTADVGGQWPKAADWQRALSVGRPYGDTTGRLQLIEFSDLECPACRAFHTVTLPALMQRYGSSLSVRLVHFPIRSHRFAMPAARAAECASEQGRFREFVDIAFTKPDSMGVKSWSSFAREAGVPDASGFAKCLTTPTRSARVDSGRALGEALKIRGTPTIVVNGWQAGNPTLAELDRIVSALSAGQKPSR